MSDEKKSTEKKTSTAKEIKGAVILTPELAKRVMAIFDEMPRRYSNLIDPVAVELMQCPQADVSLKEPEKEEK